MRAKPDDHAATTVERLSEREIAVTRTFSAPARTLFEAWTRPEIFGRWWVPKSSGLTLLACEMDARTGGGYRLEFGHPSFDKPMEFFGRYLAVEPNSRLMWTNDEGGDGAVTTVTFEERGGVTRVTVHDLFPSKAALDAEIESGATSGIEESLDQLAAMLGG
jgi:uncharacterized protein YndB with AHSA1/START domain